MSEKSQSKNTHTQPDHFCLDNDNQQPPAFELESEVANNLIEPVVEQNELLLLSDEIDSDAVSKQLTFDEFGEPIYYLLVEQLKDAASSKQAVKFHKANNILECLEKKDIHVSYQCRAGYCGSCRTQILEGEVAYIQEPLAWINDNEILPCCCVPKSMVKLKI